MIDVVRRRPFFLLMLGVLSACGHQQLEESATAVKLLPGEGMPDAGVLTAGPALAGDRLALCQQYEKRRAREGKWPPIQAPDKPVSLRAAPKNLRLEDVNEAVLKYNFGLDDNDGTGCFINAYSTDPDGTVTDFATGLMWKQQPSGAVSRTGAGEFVRMLNTRKFAGYGDWRLPTVEEMASLVDWHQYDAVSYIDLFVFRWAGKVFWTADTYEHEGFDRAWMVNVFTADTAMSAGENERAHVQAVRSL
jgi:hypothetical protein